MRRKKMEKVWRKVGESLEKVWRRMKVDFLASFETARDGHILFRKCLFRN
jgi:hypothetical protein